MFNSFNVAIASGEDRATLNASSSEIISDRYGFVQNPPYEVSVLGREF
jgi:hypothetical protein